MKKLFYVLSMAVAAMTISACNNLIEEEGPAFGAGSDNKIVFTASTATDEEGRTALDLSDGQTVVWNGSEKFGLFYTYKISGGSDTKFEVNKPYTSEATGSDKATFTGEAEWYTGEGAADESTAHKIYVYYPYNAANTSGASSVVGTLPTEQEYDAAASSWDMSKYDFVYNHNTDVTYGGPVEIGTLKRLFAVLRLGITNNTGEDVEIKKVTITSEGEKILAGDFVTNISKGRPENALTNRTDKPDSGTHGSSTAYGYWTAPSSSVSTVVTNGAVAAGKQINVRLMINAGYSKSDDKSANFFDTTTPYLAGDTFTVTIVTNKGTHPAVSFTAGALLRGESAGKSIVLDAAPAGEPSVTSMESSDSSTKFYLNSTITIKGVDLLNVVGLKIGGVAAEVISQTGTEVVAKVPDCTGTATTVAAYDVTYGDGNTKLGEINLYPFYHYENIVLGIGSNSKSTYATFASNNSFFYPDLGEVVSASKWSSDKLDKYAAESNSPIVAASDGKFESLDKTKITKEEYYATLPYVFFITNSSHKLTIVSPVNSKNGLKCHYVDETTALPTQFGTPIMWYRSMRSANNSENTYLQAVKNGTIEDMTTYTGSMASAAAPEFKSSTTDISNQSSQWHVGSVLALQYSTYEKAGKASSMSDVAKLGFIYIKEVTCADLSTGLALSPREGHIKFDMYWSKQLN